MVIFDLWSGGNTLQLESSGRSSVLKVFLKRSILIPSQNLAVNYAQNLGRPGEVVICCRNGRADLRLTKQIQHNIC